MVMPIGPLMTEHRLIERMIGLMERESEKIRREKRANFEFIEIAVDFIRTYADRLHHGKEEDILFRDLKAKKLEEQHKKTMEELIEEHRWGRKKVKELVDVNKIYKEGDESAIEAIFKCLQDLIHFYPRHIEKEDKHFFIPVMNYFSQPEQESMLEEEREFDRNIIHEIYTAKINEIKRIFS
jgi:hemerythrin-like domain-containing protein